MDGDITTSWASSSGRNSASTLQWTAAEDVHIAIIELLSNADHYDAGFRTNHGFESVFVEILDSSGALVWGLELDLAGTPDPDVVLEPAVIGRTILLTFAGQENSSTGGFAELVVFAEHS